MTNASKPPLLKTILPPVYMGLPMWQHAYWPANWFMDPQARQQGLHFYAKQLNSVEGNTTFYALPGSDSVARWQAATPDDFSFTFKFHQSISHERGLVNTVDLVHQQLALLAPLEKKLGVMMLQLPASFDARKLPLLEAFLASLPKPLHYAVEVRNPAFFAKGEVEIALNQLLIEHSANRVIMDTRGLFTGPSDGPVMDEVRTKKPRVPVNVIATGERPVVRFVGGNDDTVNQNCLQPWVKKCHAWRTQGLSPYLFFHRPDNKDAPWLAHQFISLYNQAFPEHALAVLSFTSQPAQDSLF